MDNLNLEKVSVLIPVYNVEKYIDECIETITNQTYTELEIILWDDGSSDSSLIKCLEWEKRDSRVRVFSDVNRGVATVRNNLLRIATGEWCCFVDSDDYIDKDYIYKMYEFAKKNDADFCGCYTQYKNPQKSNAFVGNGLRYLEYLYNDLVNYSSPCCKLIKTSIEKQVCYPDNHLHEDAAVCRQRAVLCSKICYIDESLYYYRDTENSITKGYSEERILDDLLWIEEDVSFYKKELYTDILPVAEKCLLYKIKYYWKYFGEDIKRIYSKKYLACLKDILLSNKNSVAARVKYLGFGIKVLFYSKLRAGK